MNIKELEKIMVEQRKIEITKEEAKRIQNDIDNGLMFGLKGRGTSYEVHFDDGVAIQMNVNYGNEGNCDILFALFKDRVKKREKVGVTTLLGTESFELDGIEYVLNVGVEPLREVRDTLYIDSETNKKVQEFLHFGFEKGKKGNLGIFEFSHDFGDEIEMFIDINLNEGRPDIHATMTSCGSEVANSCHSHFLGVYEIEFDNTRWILEVVEEKLEGDEIK